MRQLKGTATIGDGQQARKVNVSFDLERGRCLISESGTSTAWGFLGLWLATKERVLLGNVQFRVGQSEFIAKELGPFFLLSSTQTECIEDKNISNSGLAIALEIDPHTVAIDEIEIRPFNSEVQFQVMKPDLDDGSEILFHCDPRVKFDCAIRIDGEVVRVHTFRPGATLAQYVRCFSQNLDLEQYASQLRIAVSLFLGRRAFPHIVRTQSRISINLARPDQAISYGVLVQNPQRYEEVLEKLVAGSLHLRKHFLIEAFSNPGTLEVRLLNAFVHLEIIDGGKTLSPNRLSSELNIERENADALVCIRNVMIHDGLGVRDALMEARRRLKARPGGKGEVKVIEQAFQTNSPHGNFYAAVMDAFSLHLAREAGFPSDWIKRKVALSL